VKPLWQATDKVLWVSLRPKGRLLKEYIYDFMATIPGGRLMICVAKASFETSLINNTS